MSHHHGDQLTDEDLAILALESPLIAGHTCKALVLDPPAEGSVPTLDQLRASVGSRLDREPRMTEKLSTPHLGLGRPSWVHDEAFEIANHVVEYSLEAPVDHDGFLKVVAEVMATRLDRTRPLWSIHRVAMTDARLGLVVLLHHCMADGMTAVRMSSHVLWDALEQDEAAPAAPKPQDRPPVPVAANGTHPSLRSAMRRELAHHAAETPLDCHPSERRTVAVADTSLDRLKRTGHEVGMGATVNDVVLCAVAGGLRRWLEHHGGSLEGVRVKVPVSLHDHDSGDDLGNHDSFIVVDIGTEEPDPVTRLRAIRTQTRALKLDHDAQSLDRLFADMRRVSGIASDVLNRWSGSPRLFTVNVSNVPGPRHPIAVLGAPVSEMFTLAEIGDRHALRVSVISLAGTVSFGLCADAAAVSDPGLIAAGIEADLDALDAA